MASALRYDPAPQPACAHHAFNPWETLGGGTDPNIVERGKCCSCLAWLERETDLMTRTVTFRPLAPEVVTRLILDEAAELFV